MSWDFYELEKRKSNKDYICDLCGNSILKGTYYYRERGKDGDEFVDDKFHIHCNHILNTFSEDFIDDYWRRDLVIDWLRDTHCSGCKDEGCLFRPLECKHVIEIFKEE